jgi:hypothetical protein
MKTTSLLVISLSFLASSVCLASDSCSEENAKRVVEQKLSSSRVLAGKSSQPYYQFQDCKVEGIEKRSWLKMGVFVQHYVVTRCNVDYFKESAAGRDQEPEYTHSRSNVRITWEVINDGSFSFGAQCKLVIGVHQTKHDDFRKQFVKANSPRYDFNAK